MSHYMDHFLERLTYHKFFIVSIYLSDEILYLAIYPCIIVIHILGSLDHLSCQFFVVKFFQQFWVYLREHKSRCISEFVYKFTHIYYPIFRVFDICPRSVAHQQRSSHCISSILLYHLHRIYSITFGF